MNSILPAYLNPYVSGIAFQCETVGYQMIHPYGKSVMFPYDTNKVGGVYSNSLVGALRDAYHST